MVSRIQVLCDQKLEVVEFSGVLRTALRSASARG
jgi:hypothetical protein